MSGADMYSEFVSRAFRTDERNHIYWDAKFLDDYLPTLSDVLDFARRQSFERGRLYRGTGKK